MQPVVAGKSPQQPVALTDQSPVVLRGAPPKSAHRRARRALLSRAGHGVRRLRPFGPPLRRSVPGKRSRAEARHFICGPCPLRHLPTRIANRPVPRSTPQGGMTRWWAGLLSCVCARLRGGLRVQGRLGLRPKTPARLPWWCGGFGPLSRAVWCGVVSRCPCPSFVL